MKFAVSSYSFHRLGRGPEGNTKPDFYAMITTCSRLGFDGVTLLGEHFKSTEAEELHGLKQHAFRYGLAIVSVAAHNNFIQPDSARRQAEVKALQHWVDVAYELGAPSLRALSGRWGGRTDIDALAGPQDVEAAHPSHSEADAFGWTIEALTQVTDYAGRKGVTVALENQLGFTQDAHSVIRVLEGVNSPWLKAVVDIGNFHFCEDPYAEMAALAPHIVMVHAKTYLGGGIWYTADLDYGRVAEILNAVGFQGWASLEFEGKAHPDEGVPHGLAVMKACFEH